MNKHIYRSFIVLLLLFAIAADSNAQGRVLRDPNAPAGGSMPGNTGLDPLGRPPVKRNKDTTLRHRDGSDDSITVYFRYFDSTRLNSLDSSLNDIDLRFPIPYTYYHLGNLGNAANSFIFNPYRKAGFDPGFHAYDIYKFKLEDTKFYQTTRPFTQMDYILGSKAEQTIHILHTQNRSSDLNFSFNYRFVNSPGTLQNQNSSHNNLRFTVEYQSPNKRYHLYAVVINNKLKSSENGGLVDPSRLDSLQLNDPFELASRLGGNATLRPRNFFSTAVSTGTTYNETTFFIRNQYDFGQKDSLVKDTVVYRLFYPRLRIQHTLSLMNGTYSFEDERASDSNYRKYFNYTGLNTSDTVLFKDKWRNFTNEVAAISFPEKNNPNQFVKLAAGLELIKGILDTNAVTVNNSNIYALAEYRNRTRNKKWDLEARAKLYTAGSYAGDYEALVSLSRSLGKRFGFLTVGAENINRTPSYVFDPLSAFPLRSSGGFKKENITHVFASLTLPQLQLKLFGDYYLMSNYSYFDSFFHASQESTIFNVLHIGAEKKIRLRRNLNWYIEAHIQQTTMNAPVNVPFFLTRNRIVWEGKAFKNLKWATGVEIRYHTSFKPAGYSPLTGQFFYQNDWTLRNRPDVHYFLHFQITKFKVYLRLQNLNTFTSNSGGTGFKERSFRALNYPDATLWLRVGIYWSFIN